MIHDIGKVTLYVKNQEEAIEFWTNKAGFIIKTDQIMGPTTRWVEVAPSKDATTTFVLYEIELMLGQNPNANTGHPSIILTCKNMKETYEFYKSQGIEVGQLMEFPYGKMFTFHDQDRNAYMVREEP